jgi:hypothetical protein
VSRQRALDNMLAADSTVQEALPAAELGYTT